MPGYQDQKSWATGVLESVHVDDIHDQKHRKNGSLDVLSTGQINGDGSRSFKVFGLAPDQTSTPTGMRDDILLLSWLIVLLRTREGGQIKYDWAYKGRANGFKHEPINTSLSMDEVMTGSQSNIGQIAEAVSGHISTVVLNQDAAISTPASLLLSTSSLTYTSEEAKEEVSI
jgi:fusarinine C synthase